MGATWSPHGADRTHVGPMLASWTLLSGITCKYCATFISVSVPTQMSELPPAALRSVTKLQLLFDMAIGSQQFDTNTVGNIKPVHVNWRMFSSFWTVLETRTICVTGPKLNFKGVIAIVGCTQRRYIPGNYACDVFIYMMTSSNGSIFRVTGPLCTEFTGHLWIPVTKASEWRGALLFSLICA